MASTCIVILDTACRISDGPFHIKSPLSMKLKLRLCLAAKIIAATWLLLAIPSGILAVIFDTDCSGC
jgi:hypothetical protein